MHTLFTCSCISRWSGRVLPPVTGRFRVRVVISSHCIGEDKACHWHPSLDPAQSGSSLHWVRPFFFVPAGEHTELLEQVGVTKVFFLSDGHSLHSWMSKIGFHILTSRCQVWMEFDYGSSAELVARFFLWTNAMQLQWPFALAKVSFLNPDRLIDDRTRAMFSSPNSAPPKIL